jgi:hypothetical protein
VILRTIRREETILTFVFVNGIWNFIDLQRERVKTGPPTPTVNCGVYRSLDVFTPCIIYPARPFGDIYSQIGKDLVSGGL